MSQSSRSHLTRAIKASPRDGAFLRTFAATLVGLLVALALLVRVTDPFAAFGTGLVPPIVSADRDYKAALYRSRTPPPEVVLLGSSRIKTLRPGCVSALTGRPAFNFGVNAGVAEDFLAIFRFMRSQPRFEVREILLGAEPEAFTGDPSLGRALAQSRSLVPFVSQVEVIRSDSGVISGARRVLWRRCARFGTTGSIGTSSRRRRWSRMASRPARSWTTRFATAVSPNIQWFCPRVTRYALATSLELASRPAG